ncbi:T9SS type A sorting domain-containing protein [Salegentibacter sp. LM13S]|nr:T9SS type A sorting domain-containing protein [Salegentibacter lacus]
MSNCGGYYSVSPNPASDIIKVKFEDEVKINKSEDVILVLYNLSGHKIKQERVGIPNSYMELKVSDLKKGIYILKIISEERQETHKIIKK